MRGKHTRKVKHQMVSPGPYQCHPRVGEKRPAHGCLPVDVLSKSAAALNVSHGGSAASLRRALEERLGVGAKNEMSFLRALPLPEKEKSTLAQLYLRPKQPDDWRTDPDKWLDSLNIEDVMKQYEEARPDFEFMGPFPIDFAAPDPYAQQQKGSGRGKKCLIDEVCELRVTEAFQNGTKYIGVIYNLDPHFKSGSHWVSVFIDIPKHRCYYFDSYGMYPPKQIETFMKWLTTQDPRMRLAYNGRRFQTRDTECGMYSLYFIIRMLSGDNFRSFTRQSPPDEQMLQLRHWFFST